MKKIRKEAAAEAAMVQAAPQVEVRDEIAEIDPKAIADAIARYDLPSSDDEGGSGQNVAAPAPAENDDDGGEPAPVTPENRKTKTFWSPKNHVAADAEIPCASATKSKKRSSCSSSGAAAKRVCC